MFPILPRLANRRIARLLLGIVLFMQMLTSAHACTPSQRDVGFARTTMHAAVAACHHHGAVDAATCVAHCSTADQNVDTHHVPAWVAPASAVLTVPLAPCPGSHQSGTVRPASRIASGDPPISIRFQVFRI